MIIRLAVLFLLIPSLAWAIEPPANPAYEDTVFTLDATLPTHIHDTAAESWVAGMYLGNFSISGWWYDAHRLEVGVYNPEYCVTTPTDDMTYCTVAGSGQNAYQLVRIDNSTGAARLFLDSTGLDYGDSEEVRSGWPFYNPYDDSLYLMGYGACIRKVVDDGDGTWSVAVVSGVCEDLDTTDGTGWTGETPGTARLGFMNGAAADGLGNIYAVQGQTLRLIDVDGDVTTITPTRAEAGCSNWTVLNNNQNMIHASTDPTEFWISDQQSGTNCGYTILKYDTETEVLTSTIGIQGTTGDPDPDPYDRYSREHDGPATPPYFAHSHAGAWGVYSPFYESYFYNGQDNVYLQRYSDVDGWVRTYGGKTIRPGVTQETITFEDMMAGGVSFEQAWAHRYIYESLLIWTKSVCSRGGIFVTYSASSAGGAGKLYRLYNPALGGVE